MNTKWKKIFTCSVFAFTLYNLLPSVFYYSKPLSDPISFKQASEVLNDWEKASSSHEKETSDWITQLGYRLNIPSITIQNLKDCPRTLSLEFSNVDEAALFEKKFPEAIANAPYKNYKMQIAASEDKTLYLVKKFPSPISIKKDTLYIQAGSNLDSDINLKSLVETRLKNIVETLSSYDFIKSTLSQIDGLNNLTLFKSAVIDYNTNEFKLELESDIAKKIDHAQVRSLLSDVLSKLGEDVGEVFSINKNLCTAKIIQNPDRPFLLTKVGNLSKVLSQEVFSSLKNLFKPKSSELNSSNYPVVTTEQFHKLSVLDQENCLIFHNPNCDISLFKNQVSKSSLYIVAKNFEKLVKDNEGVSTTETKLIQKDLRHLQKLVQAFEFQTISNALFGKEFKNDLIFECKDFYKPSLEIFHNRVKTYGSLPLATFELGTLKDLLSEQGKLSKTKQENLVLWQQSYNAARNNDTKTSITPIAAPTKNPLISNLILNIKNYFNGSEKKALKFGLDLSGGKHILIQLEDKQGKKVTDPVEIKSAINQLYNRVNRLGVSEVSIRQEGDYISLDFPGSQNLSARELINSSTMYFHVVNEEFSFQNQEVFPLVLEFLEKVWKKALHEGNTEALNLQKIGYKLLNDPYSSHDSIKKLKEKGLNLADPDKHLSSSSLDNSLSKIVNLKQEADEKNACPLMIVFNNYALEGSALKDIRCSYDPTKGNFLSFNISNQNAAQERLSNWTAYFTKNKQNQSYKPQRGWRMAVILNSQVVSAPVLESALKDSASINGSFSQQDLLKLKSDFEAGSLNFEPRILLEQNMAPELGIQDQRSALISMSISLILVVALMVTYYRFHGLVATSALVINLLMLLAASSFFNITLSLASIAGMILTLGMAVDANVLIFERMREEQSKGTSLKDTIKTGYAKAFTAIIDSNLTTMIAAFILLGFDSGPIKGFALTLLIGLFTSVITALVMTKLFYFEWMEKTKKASLNFSNWFNFKPLNFLNKSKTALITSLVIVVFGIAGFSYKSSQIVGMDFKGGYAFDLKLKPNSQKLLPKKELAKALINQGLKSSHIHVKELENSHHLRVFLDPEIDKIKNPSQNWKDFISESLLSQSLVCDEETINNIDQQVTTISGQFSDSMRNQALWGLAIALVAIFIYLLLRFEWPYALAATLSLVHDVILTLCLMAILAYFGVPVSLDMSSLAALLTIIGYSLNDTIIVFDRIREEKLLNPEMKLFDVISKSVNSTLSRTLLTSGTTLIVLIPMIFLGQGTLFNFSLIMTIGVVFGTLSTLYLASPILLAFSKSRKTNSINN